MSNIEKSKRPLILVTNDDGVQAIGLEILVEHLQDLGDIIVCAPDREQSGVGHGISLSRSLRVKEVAPKRFAISGTPADTVILGIVHLCNGQRPSLVISGINAGPNLGTDVFYSGTLAGAFEAALHDVPALAVSQEIDRYPLDKSNVGPLRPLFERTARFAAHLAKQALSNPLPPRTILNINAPLKDTCEFVWTRMGKRIYREHVEKRIDLFGVPYYWLGGPPILGKNGPGTDSHAQENGLISITPLGLDLTVELPTCYHQWQMDGFSLRS